MQEQSMEYTGQITNIERSFLPKDFKVIDWQTLEPYFIELTERPITSKEILEKWLQDVSEVEAVIGEDAAQLLLNDL